MSCSNPRVLVWLWWVKVLFDANSMSRIGNENLSWEQRFAFTSMVICPVEAVCPCQCAAEAAGIWLGGKQTAALSLEGEWWEGEVSPGFSRIHLTRSIAPFSRWHWGMWRNRGEGCSGIQFSEGWRAIAAWQCCAAPTDILLGIFPSHLSITKCQVLIENVGLLWLNW